MIRPGFLDSESRRDLIELARDGSAAPLARRANALVLLDKGMSCHSIAEVLLLDGDTIRTWFQLYHDVVHRSSASTTSGGSGQSSVSQMARSSSASRTVTCWFARMQAVQATMIRRLMAGMD